MRKGVVHAIRVGRKCADAMTFEEHRIQFLKRITDCAGPQIARELIAQEDLLLEGCRLQPSTLHGFWKDLRADLDVLQEELAYVSDHEARVQRGAVIAAALVAATGLVNKFAEVSAESARKLR